MQWLSPVLTLFLSLVASLFTIGRAQLNASSSPTPDAATNLTRIQEQGYSPAGCWKSIPTAASTFKTEVLFRGASSLEACLNECKDPKNSWKGISACGFTAVAKGACVGLLWNRNEWEAAQKGDERKVDTNQCSTVCPPGNFSLVNGCGGPGEVETIPLISLYRMSDALLNDENGTAKYANGPSGLTIGYLVAVGVLLLLLLLVGCYYMAQGLNQQKRLKSLNDPFRQSSMST